MVLCPLFQSDKTSFLNEANSELIIVPIQTSILFSWEGQRMQTFPSQFRAQPGSGATHSGLLFVSGLRVYVFSRRLQTCSAESSEISRHSAIQSLHAVSVSLQLGARRRAFPSGGALGRLVKFFFKWKHSNVSRFKYWSATNQPMRERGKKV